MTYPEPTNISDGILGMMQYANRSDVSGMYFGMLVLLLVYISLFLYLINKGYESSDSLTASGFFTAFLAVLLNLGNVITDKTMYFAILGLIIPAFWLFIKKS
jgi:hypothetical protein